MENLEEDLIRICLKSPVFKRMAMEISGYLKDENFGGLNPWIDEKEAMSLLRISSKVTFQKYRDEGNIEVRKISTKKYLYRRQSILDFIENSPKE